MRLQKPDRLLQVLFVVSLQSRYSPYDGYAANAGEAHKHRTYDDAFNANRYRLVPLVQGTYGRMGVAGVKFLKMLATYAARCRGGTALQMQLRHAATYADFRTELSMRLGAESAERLAAYARVAEMEYGHTVRPLVEV